MWVGASKALKENLKNVAFVRNRLRKKQESKFRFQLMREDIPLTPRIRLNLMGNTHKEYMAGLRYIVTKYFGISTHYDSDMGFGAGITLTY